MIIKNLKFKGFFIQQPNARLIYYWNLYKLDILGYPLSKIIVFLNFKFGLFRKYNDYKKFYLWCQKIFISKNQEKII